jgi:hypothetical protein
MQNSQIFSGIVGFAMPYLVEAIKTKLPDTKGRWLGYVLSYGFCVIVGGLTAFFEGGFDAENILASTGTALITSQGFYNLYFKAEKIDMKIQKALK